MSRRASPRVIGAFVVAAAALAVGAVLVFGSGRLFRETYTFVAYFDSNVSGLAPGAPVKFRGVEVGTVRDVRLALRDEIRPLEDNSIAVVFDLDADRIRSKGSLARINDPVYVDSLINQVGFRAQLTLESLVTGRMYIELNVLPDREARFASLGGPYQEIPTVRTGFEELQAKLFDIVAEVGEVELDSILQSFFRVVGSVEELVSSPEVKDAIESLSDAIGELETTLHDAQRLMASADSSIGPLRVSLTETSDRFAATADQLDSTLVSLRTVLEPGSPIVHQLEVALRDFAAATRSLRSLTEFLERNPSAILRGRPEDKP